MRIGDVRKWERAFKAMDEGFSPEIVARKSGLSPSTIYRFLRGDQTSGGLEAADRLGRNMVGEMAISKPLDPLAQTALADFAEFRMRYTGRKSLPWQVRAAYDCVVALESKEREFLVVNCPPGSGKSTLFTHDIPAWLIARDRTIRIMIGSRTERQARMYVSRLKKTMERDVPMRTDADSLAQGISFDAVATMQGDFGGFKPTGREDLWRGDALVVRQLDGVALDDKEPTVSAWGQDSGFLGGRFDFVVWDDLVDRKNTKTLESQDSLREWFSTEAETRLEPGGMFLLQGQRIAHNDLYRYALDQQDLNKNNKYKHIVYPAHDDENCRGHDEDVTQRPPSWPDGCLLDPYRLPMKTLETIKYNNPRVFEVQYQQRDGDLVGGLIEQEWIKGGTDSQGYVAPGCLDPERGCNEIPPHLTDGNGWSFITVDPSPTEWWGIIWWVYDPVTTNRYAIDIIRRRMNPEDFLTLDLDTFAYSGLLEEKRQLSNSLRAPLQYVIVEINAAQRWLLQQPHVQRWIESTNVVIVGHTTHVNKANPEFGLESIGDLFRRGQIRLPHKGVDARVKVHNLTREAYAYPDVDTTDLLMSTWFGKLAVENLYTPGYRRNAFPRPQDLLGSSRGLAGYSRGLAAFSR